MQPKRMLTTKPLLGLAVSGVVACLPTSDTHARARSIYATHRLTYTTSSSHSCSRSHASTRHNGSMTLRIGRHRATLTMDDVKTYRIGPSRGRFRRLGAGKSQSSTTRVRRQYTWRGKVRRSSGGGVSVTLTPQKTTCTALPLYGTKGGRIYKCYTTPSVTLQCKVAAAMAYRPVAKGGFAGMVSKNEKSRSVSALRCTAVKPPRLLNHARFGTAFLFARKPGLALYSRSGGFLGHRTRSHLRR